MNTDVFVLDRKGLTEKIKPIIKKQFSQDSRWDETRLENAFRQIMSHVDRMRPNLSFVLETEYVDKVYRNSYYHYYSSKSSNYARNCIRLSIFEGALSYGDFRIQEKQIALNDAYRGFIILRPTLQSIIGRSQISPKVLLENDFLICSATVASSANAVKLKAIGFPSQSQDGETISCAETTIWAIMEYFGHKYAEYKPTSPKEIINVLKQTSPERQIPSKGLQITQISYALRLFGFGTITYSRAEFGIEFDRILSCYIHSAIPVITAVHSTLDKKAPIGHAMICVGYQKLKPIALDSLRPDSTYNNPLPFESEGTILYDLDDLERKFVFVDDNSPPYQCNPLSAPCQHYNHDNWKSCKITHFSVPLYPKVHLDAIGAKLYAKSFLLSVLLNGTSFPEAVTRTFLTSQRSYKDWVSTNNFAEAFPIVKSLVLKETMPKFIWVTEISTKALLKLDQPKALGIIILDATEPLTEDRNAVLFASIFLPDFTRLYSTELKIQELNVTLQEFDTFENLNDFSA